MANSTEEKSAEKAMAEDKRKLEAERAARDKAYADHMKMVTGRPTPTQEELDLIKLGHHPELAPDGSTDPYAAANAKSIEASQPGSYQTRQTRAEHRQQTEHKPAT